jgi:hypothetical protein
MTAPAGDNKAIRLRDLCDADRRKVVGLIHQVVQLSASSKHQEAVSDAPQVSPSRATDGLGCARSTTPLTTLDHAVTVSAQELRNSHARLQQLHIQNDAVIKENSACAT